MEATVQHAALRILCLATLVSVASATTANAADVYVQWAVPAGSGVITDPAYATNTIAGAFTEADLGTGIFKGTAFSSGVAQVVSVSSAYSGMSTLIFTNTGASPATIGGADPFDVTVDATFAHTASSDGSWATQLIAILLVDVPGDPMRQAEVAFSAAELWASGGVSSSAFDINSVEVGGGFVTVTTGTPSALKARLSMPAITLDPAETMTVHLSFQPVAITVDSGFTATTTMSTARIRMRLPAGVTLSNDATVPLDWVEGPLSVPTLGAEMLGLEVLALAAIALYALRRRRLSQPG